VLAPVFSFAFTLLARLSSPHHSYFTVSYVNVDYLVCMMIAFILFLP
jgi:hypothetical protein